MIDETTWIEGVRIVLRDARSDDLNVLAYAFSTIAAPSSPAPLDPAPGRT
jgi:hypothetical protein